MVVSPRYANYDDVPESKVSGNIDFADICKRHVCRPIYVRFPGDSIFDRICRALR